MYTVKSKRTNSRKIKSRRTNSKRTNSRKIKSRVTKSRRIKNRRTKSHLKGGDTYDLECPLCMETLGSPPGEPIQLPCGHKYHRKCANQLCNSEHSHCLVCQRAFTCEDVNNTDEIMNVVNADFGDQ